MPRGVGELSCLLPGRWIRAQLEPYPVRLATERKAYRQDLDRPGKDSRWT